MFTFTTEADAYVTSAQPGANFGAELRLRTNTAPTERSYVRFNVQGLPGGASSATLRIRALTGSGSGFNVHVANSNGWGETTITYNNAPGFGGAVAGSGGYGAGSWVEVNVTGQVSGNGQVTFVLTAANAALNAYAARELSGYAAELVVVSP